MRIIPIASGKGGVGKSLIAANLGVVFAQAGKRVVLVDLDLGASNLHLVIGHQAPKMGIGTFLNDTKIEFASVIAETDAQNLRFIPGDTEIPGLANLKASQRNILVKKLLSLENNTDILLIDLGAGTHQSILDFFLLSGQGIVVTAPAVTAVLNAYVFIKNTVFRMLNTIFAPGTKAHEYLGKMKKSGGYQRLYIPKILPEIKRIDNASYEAFMDHLNRFHPRLITNMIENPKDADVAVKIRRSCEEYLAIKIEHLGIIYRDALQDISLASRLPITLYKPGSVLSQAVYRIADKILQSAEDHFSITDKEINESFLEAGAEAEVDFESKMEYVEDLLHSGALSHGDLIETVKIQQIEINKLKKENNFLKTKLTKAFTQGFRV
ncbi:MAG: AAA family ATPase [Treponema sp.]|jgi:flagellar biosynthesis protein FlhG|nr:AAA family ATPase [Treponema sp.]